MVVWKKSPMNCILSQLEIEVFTLLVSRKWRLGRILFLELKGHLWPRNVHLGESCFSVLSYLIYPRNGETYKNTTSADLFPPRAPGNPCINHVSRILDFQVFILVLCDQDNSHLDYSNWNLDCLPRYKSQNLFFEITEWETKAHGPNLAYCLISNKVLLEYGHICSFTYCLWMLLCHNGRAEYL